MQTSHNQYASNLYGISTISGQWTRARLRKHFTEQQITSAISRNVLTEDRTGTIRAVPGKTRLLEQDLQPGEMVVRMVDGKPIQMMVVRDDQGNTQLVNPEAPNEPQQSVPEDELITPEEIEGMKELGVESGGDKGTYSNPLAESGIVSFKQVFGEPEHGEDWDCLVEVAFELFANFNPQQPDTASVAAMIDQIGSCDVVGLTDGKRAAIYEQCFHEANENQMDQADRFLGCVETALREYGKEQPQSGDPRGDGESPAQTLGESDALNDIPPSPMRFKRCGECGCPEGGGASRSGHSTACSKYDHLSTPGAAIEGRQSSLAATGHARRLLQRQRPGLARYGKLAESLLENRDTGPRGFSDAIRAGVKLAKADPYYGQPDEEPEQPGVLDLEDEEQWPTLQAAAERYGEQKIVQFIYNRHCSRFDPSTTSLADAIDKAWQYHTDEDTILEDFRTVDSYGDLAQYMRP